MTKSNKALLSKADIALSDITNDGGLLNPEQADTFVRKLIKSPTILRMARVVTMASPTRKINKIQFGSRIMRKAVASTALSSGDRSKPTTEQIELNASEIIAEVHLPYDVLEDNIERAEAANNEASNSGPGGLRQTIIELIAERAALDLEELALLGDTTSTDDYLALQDGWLKLVNDNGNVVDFDNGTVSKALFKAGKKAMPDQYLRNLGSINHFVSMDNHTEYQDTLANRQTGLGDSNVTGTNALMAYGSPVTPVSQMPEDQGLFTNPLNLILGMHRDMSMEFDKDIRARVYIIVITARVALQVEETEAAVIYTNIAEAD